MNGERAGVAVDADALTVGRCLAGDSHAFDSLFAKYQDYVYNIAFGIIGKAEDARDVTQDVFEIGRASCRERV